MPLARERPSDRSVARAMSRDLLTATPEEPLVEACRRMAERRVGAVLVTEGARLVGILTERDVLHAVGRGTIEGTVREWMTPDPITIATTGTTGEAASLMIHGGFRHVPVVEGDDLVGIVSIRDIIRVQADTPAGV
jgi:CBS domain-containing protein